MIDRGDIMRDGIGRDSGYSGAYLRKREKTGDTINRESDRESKSYMRIDEENFHLLVRSSGSPGVSVHMGMPVLWSSRSISARFTCNFTVTFMRAL